jgi:16S rRNA processing protein RimM
MGESDKRVLVARVGGAHGVTGAVRLTVFTQDPRAFSRYGPLTDEKGRRFEVESVRHARGSVIARLAQVTSREAAQELAGTRLFVGRAFLPEIADPDEFYYHDLIGLEVISTGGEAVGRVIAVHDFGAGEIVEIEYRRGGTEMSAFTRANFPEIDLASGNVSFNAPGTVEAREEKA